MHFLRVLASSCVLLLVSTSALAEYSPDVLELDGKSGLMFPAFEEVYLGSGGTVEFWVAPDWTKDPGYDPVVLSNAGVEGASYLVAVLRDRDGIGVVSGESEHMVGFDFSDNSLHHVAIVYLEGQLVVYIDGRLQSTSEFNLLDLPATGLWIGTADGSMAPFVGAIAELRIWGTPVAQKSLVEFAGQDVRDGTSGHPDFSTLRAVSDFTEAELLYSMPAEN